MGPPEVSQRQAALRARVSAKTWANVESGQIQVTRGMKVPHTPDEETVRLIAQSLGLEDEVSERLGISVPVRVRAPLAEQLRETRGLFEEGLRRLDEIESQLET